MEAPSCTIVFSQVQEMSSFQWSSPLRVLCREMCSLLRTGAEGLYLGSLKKKSTAQCNVLFFSFLFSKHRSCLPIGPTGPLFVLGHCGNHSGSCPTQASNRMTWILRGLQERKILNSRSKKQQEKKNRRHKEKWRCGTHTECADIEFFLCLQIKLFL